jgi:hypothetical protein
MITDPELDLFNRVIIWSMYLDYCTDLADADLERARALRASVLSLASTFPPILSRTAPGAP